MPVTLGKGQFALGKLFAECYTRQTPLGKASHGKGIFAECRISGTRQRLCREPWHSAKQPRGATLGRHFAENFAECRRLSLGKVPAQGGATWPLCRVLDPGTRQTFETLPSARVLALGQVLSCCPVEGHFAECIGLSTRQSDLFFFFCFFFLYFMIQIQQICI